MSQYKAAVIGLGKIGLEYDVTSLRHPESHTLAYVLDDGFQLACAMDVQQDKRKMLHHFSPTTKFYTDLSTMFVDNPDVDLVSICTPPRFHLHNLEYLIRHTNVQNIFCEKPLISSLKELSVFKELLSFRRVTIVPNLSRRWNTKIQSMREKIVSEQYGKLQKVIIRYTRGIYNTGAHLFDLLHWCGINILRVQVIDEVYTTSDQEGEKTFSFTFFASDGVRGYAEAFNDTQYYCFDIDFYFSKGKISFQYNGNDILYYSVGKHHLFPQFPELELENSVHDALSESCLAFAMKEWKGILGKTAAPRCSWQDAIYPLLIAGALEKSYQSGIYEEVWGFE